MKKNYLTDRLLEKLDIDSAIRYEYVNLLNIYIFMLIGEIFIYAILDFFRGFYSPFFTNLLLMAYLIFSFFSKIKYIKIYQFGFFIFFSFSLFFSSSYCGFESGMLLLYIPFVFSIVFIFNIIQDKYLVLVILFLIFVQVSINFYTDHSLFYNPSYTDKIQKQVLITNIFSVVLNIFLIIYFLYRKELLMTKFYEREEVLKEKINSFSINKEISIDDIKSLNELAESKSPTFFIKFHILFPLFIEKITKEYPEISQSEMEVCAYIKLNYSTKDIARFTNSSVRGIESKKYRIRKKFNLATNENLNNWMIGHDNFTHIKNYEYKP